MLVSAPALAAALRAVDQLPGGAFQPALHLDELVAMYRIEAGAGEVASALRVLGDVGERLRRLGAAYGEWQRFEPEPYFDLRPHQAAELLHISERVTTVHAVCFADALLPSFQAALAYFLDDFVPARRRGAAALETAAMVEKWLQLTAVLRAVRAALANDAAFLEHERHRRRAQPVAGILAGVAAGRYARRLAARAGADAQPDAGSDLSFAGLSSAGPAAQAAPRLDERP